MGFLKKVLNITTWILIRDSVRWYINENKKAEKEELKKKQAVEKLKKMIKEDEEEKEKKEIRIEKHRSLAEKAVEDLKKNSGESVENELLLKAIEVIRDNQKASPTLLQRKLNIKFEKAADIIDFLEEKWIVWPLDWARPRDVYIK